MSDLRLHQCLIENRFTILDCLGRGSYAEIYVARDMTTLTANQAPQLIVIKALNTQLQGVPDLDLERTLVDNFRNEAVALDRVRHPNIISRLGYGTAVDRAGRQFEYILLEYLPGGDLAAICRHQPLAIEHALYYLQQVCAGLAHAHECGVIHRDIKPQNLLLTADRQTIKIADFGVAKIKMIEEATGTITRVGTDIYAAPEHHPLQAVATHQDSASLVRTLEPVHLLPAADIYSLAKTTYMILTGEAPRRFSQQSITDFPASLSDKPWANSVLAVLRRATQTPMNERYQTVAEFWAELASAVSGTRSATAVAAEPSHRNNGSSNGASLPRSETKKVAVDESSSVAQNSVPVSPTPVKLHEEANAERLAEPSRSRFTVSVADETQQVRQQQNTSVTPQQVSQKRSSRSSGRLTRWLIGLFLIASFAGMLFATHYYVRTRIWPRISPNQTNPLIGREFFTTNNVNLRTEPTAATNQNIVGIVIRNSRVRVVDVRGNWYQVEVRSGGITNQRSDFAGRGWLDSNFLRPE